MDQRYRIGKELTLKAGKFIRENYEGRIKIDFKGEIDIVTDIDLKAENILISGIKQNFPDDNIITEETDIEQKEAEYRWIIDPLDGTTNFSHGFPFFCVSVAVEYKSEIVSGFVYDPLREELFEVNKGEKPHLNGREIEPSKIEKLDRALLATGFPYDIRESKKNNVNFFSHIIYKAQAVRRAGSAALDLCYVACGRLDGYWELKLKPWDTAAAGLIIKQAGGIITDLSNKSENLLFNEVAASNGLIHKELLKELNEAGK